jgi:hypothetical protein
MLTILWLIPSFLSIFLPLLGHHNLIMLSYAGLLINLWIAYFLKFRRKYWNYAAMVFIVLLFTLNITLKGGGALDYSALRFSTMFLPSFMILLIMVCLFRLLTNLKQEGNLLDHADYWIYSALLFYFFFLALQRFVHNLALTSPAYNKVSLFALFAANLIFSVFFLIGIKKWWKSLQVK